MKFRKLFWSLKFIKILSMKDYANSRLKLKQTVIWAFGFIKNVNRLHNIGWYLKVKVTLLKVKTLFTEGKGFFASFSCTGNVRSLISRGSQTWRFHSAFILQCSLLHLALNWVLELLSDPGVMRSTPSLCPLHLTKSSHLSSVWWWLTNIVKQLCLSFATFILIGTMLFYHDMLFWLGQHFFLVEPLCEYFPRSKEKQPACWLCSWLSWRKSCNPVHSTTKPVSPSQFLFAWHFIIKMELYGSNNSFFLLVGKTTLHSSVTDLTEQEMQTIKTFML